MKNFIKGALAIASVATLIGASYGCDQPEPQCATGRGQFWTQYKLVGGGAGCADIKGEIYGINTYSAVGDGQPDYNKASAAFETQTMSGYILNTEAAGVGDPDTSHKPYVLGNFVESTATGNLCHIPTLTPAIQNFPEVTEDEDLGTSAQPATNVTYTFSNVVSYVTADSNGQQITADVTYVDTGADLNCQFRALMLYPSVDCTLLDASGKPILDANKKPQPDETACDPVANDGLVAKGGGKHGVGSGINPDFKTHCDADTLHCTLNEGTALLPF